MAPTRRGRGRILRERDLRFIIAENPSAFTIERETTPTASGSFGAGTFGPSTIETFGPFEGVIEPFRHTRVADTFDEKGKASSHGYILMAIAEGGLLSVDTFKLNDTIVRGNERFRVTSPHLDANVWEVNVELYVL